MEKERKQQILDALALIKDICKELECDKCPFRINDCCAVRCVIPAQWSLNQPPEAIWRAFKE